MKRETIDEAIMIVCAFGLVFSSIYISYILPTLLDKLIFCISLISIFVGTIISEKEKNETKKTR